MHQKCYNIVNIPCFKASKIYTQKAAINLAFYFLNDLKYVSKIVYIPDRSYFKAFEIYIQIATILRI